MNATQLIQPKWRIDHSDTVSEYMIPHATAAVSTTCASTIPYTLRRKAWRSRTSTAAGRAPTWKK